MKRFEDKLGLMEPMSFVEKRSLIFIHIMSAF